MPIQVFAFMLDNASNNDTMVDGIKARAALEEIKLDAAWARLRCMPHTIHLAAVKVSSLISVLIVSLTQSLATAARSNWCHFKG